MNQHHTKVCLLLTSFTFFWLWQIVMPVLDQHLPLINIGHSDLFLPVSEIISQYLGAATLLSGYALYSVVSYGELSFKMNVAFMLTAFMITSGHGVHVACVTIQTQMATHDPLYALVYFLHEHWSHNMFLTGFYSLIFLLIWAERNCSSKQPRNPTAAHTGSLANGSTTLLSRTYYTNGKDTPKADELVTDNYNCCQECRQLPPLSGIRISGCLNKVTMTTIDNHHHKNRTVHYQLVDKHCVEHHTTKIVASKPCMSHDHKRSLKGGKCGKTMQSDDDILWGRQTIVLLAKLIVLWTTWVWPVVVGTYFSVFALMTSTKPLTTMFYFGVLFTQMKLYKELPFEGLTEFFKEYHDNNTVISSFFTKAVLVGLPIMLL